MGYILFVLLRYADLTSLLSVYVIVTSFILLILLGEESERFRVKLGLALLLPLTYLLMYILTAVEFLALIKSARKSRQLFKREMHKSSWEHVERSGEPVSLG